MLWPQATDRSPHQVGEVTTICQGWWKPAKGPQTQLMSWTKRAPLSETRVIIGGNTMVGSSKKARKTYLSMVQSIQNFGRPPKATKIDNPAISFTKEDAKWLHHPNVDVLVFSLSITNYNTWQVLIDDGSSTDILYYPTFQQMRVDKGYLLPLDTPLVGFEGTKLFPIGTITVLITIGTYS